MKNSKNYILIKLDNIGNAKRLTPIHVYFFRSCIFNIYYKHQIINLFFDKIIKLPLITNKQPIIFYVLHS